MSALVLLLVCAAACALPSNKNIIQDVEEINSLDVIGSASKPTMPSNNNALTPVSIIGGNETTIDHYPFVACILGTGNMVTYGQFCGGSIINTRSVLTAAHCRLLPKYVRLRVGSSFKSSGGTVYNTVSFTRHPNYNETTKEYDIAIVRSATTIVYVPHAVQPAVTAPADYNLADNEKVWAVGWGDTEYFGSVKPEQLRHVQIFSINLNVCKERYKDINRSVTDNMLCSGILDVAGKNVCYGDSGGPLIYNGVVVGICSWGPGYCASARYPAVDTRVSRFAEWIEKNK